MDIAIVGVGKIALDQHVPAIAASADWTLAATVSRHGAVPDIPSFRDFDAMLKERPEIGTVSLCMPPVPRFAYSAAAIRAGRHVMLEKPPGATLSEVHALHDMADRAGVCLFTTWHSREAGQVAAAKAWLAGKRLLRLAVNWREDVRKWHPGQDWIWEPGGMGVFDPGINALSIVTEILPDPIHLACAELDVPQNRQSPIGATLDFTHPKGAEVSVVFDWRQTGDQIWEIEVETDGGTLVLSDGGSNLSIDGERQPCPDGLAEHHEYPSLYDKMARYVRAGTSDVDLSPMRHVADAMTLGRRTIVAPFEW